MFNSARMLQCLPVVSRLSMLIFVLLVYRTSEVYDSVQ